MTKKINKIKHIYHQKRASQRKEGDRKKAREKGRMKDEEENKAWKSKLVSESNTFFKKGEKQFGRYNISSHI